MKKIAIASFSILIILSLVGAYFFVFKKHVLIVPTIETIEVKQGDLDVEIVSSGELTSVKSDIILLPDSLFAGFSINEIQVAFLVPEGTLVEKGEVIAKLDESVYTGYKTKIEREIAELKNNISNIVQDSTNQLKDLKLALENARLDVEINKIAVDQSLFDPPTTHERMKLEHRKSLLTYENALINYQSLKNTLLEKYSGYTQKLEQLTVDEKTKLPQMLKTLNVRAPYPGIISFSSDKNRSKSSAVITLTPENRVVATIDDISKLVSNCYIKEEYYPEIRVGQGIIIILKTNGRQINTTISFISHKIESLENNKYFSIGTVISNPEYDLIPNQTTINRIPLGTLKNVTYVPNTSILTEGGKTYVFSEERRRQEVICEKGNESFTVIKTGLTPGQLILQDAHIAAVN